ncbi:YybH family protein [Jatrophihabitans sp.]|uniref:YybH family protein n=1 Tax=Jatrophihabitans sp. TaxID=1932789 RepID=UPI002B869068|nr:nuclear transport factor 2 family protein [Jatrophihabitans sp.]
MTGQHPRSEGELDPERAAAPAQLPELFMRAYNAGDLAKVNRLFETGAGMALSPEAMVYGPDRVEAMRAFYERYQLPIVITVRAVHECGDLALVVGDHVMEGRCPDGEVVRVTGTAADVARRGPDGYWRYVIDNPGIQING